MGLRPGRSVSNLQGLENKEKDPSTHFLNPALCGASHEVGVPGCLGPLSPLIQPHLLLQVSPVTNPCVPSWRTCPFIEAFLSCLSGALQSVLWPHLPNKHSPQAYWNILFRIQTCWNAPHTEIQTLRPHASLLFLCSLDRKLP